MIRADLQPQNVTGSGDLIDYPSTALTKQPTAGRAVWTVIYRCSLSICDKRHAVAGHIPGLAVEQELIGIHPLVCTDVIPDRPIRHRLPHERDPGRVLVKLLPASQLSATRGIDHINSLLSHPNGLDLLLGQLRACGLDPLIWPNLQPKLAALLGSSQYFR